MAIIAKHYRLARLVLLLGLVCVSVEGCNTMAGAGQDVKNTGQAVKNSANNN